jgi:hypothetical protein
MSPLFLVVPVRQVRRGRIGSEATVEVPTLANGDGMLLDLQLELGRRFKQEGRSAGYVTAECRGDRLVAAMKAVFTDSTIAEEESTRVCSSSRAAFSGPDGR